MRCDQAKQIIDQRVQALAEGADALGGDWAELDGHLAECAACRVDFEELVQMQAMLASLAVDGPGQMQSDTIWQAIQDARTALQRRVEGQWLQRKGVQFAAAVGGLAAVLLMALLIGQQHSGKQRRLAARTRSLSSVATASTTYAADGVAVNGLDLDFSYDVIMDSLPPREYTQALLPSPDALKHGKDEKTGSETDDRPPRSQKPRRRVRGTTLGKSDLEQLESLGYLSATPRKRSRPGATPMPTPSHIRAEDRTKTTADAFRQLVESGAVNVHQFISPSSDDIDEDFASLETIDFSRLNTVRYGYEVPLMATASAGDAQVVGAAGASTYDGSRFLTGGGVFVSTLSNSTVEDLGAAAEAAQFTFSGVDPSAQSGGQGEPLFLYDNKNPEESKVVFLSSQQALKLAREEREALELDRPSTDAAEAVQPSGGQVGSTASEPAVTSPSRPDRKIIKTATLVLEVPEYDAAAERVREFASRAGGFVADVSLSESAGGALVGRLVIRVSPEAFEALFAALKDIGRIESEDVKAADVTAQYVDLEARIGSLEVTAERLQGLVQHKSFMDSIESILRIEQEANRVRSEIETLQGQLRVMASRVSMSSIAVTLKEPARIVPSATLKVEVDSVEVAAAALNEALTGLGGRMASGKTTTHSGASFMGNYLLFVTLDRFGELVGAIEGIGRVAERQVKDFQPDDAGKPWAAKVRCPLTLVFYESSRQLPNGNLTIEVQSVREARKKLDEILAGAGGAISSSDGQSRPDGTSESKLKLRVAAGQFGHVVEALDSLGRILVKAVAGQAGRILGGAAAVPCDINLTLTEKRRQIPSGGMTVVVEAFEPAREALSRLVASEGVQVLASASNQANNGTWTGQFRLGIKAAGMEGVVKQLEGLGRVASRQIVGLGLGDLSGADPEALGVIELHLMEKQALTPGPDRAGDTLRARMRDGLAGFYYSLGLIAYGFFVMGPWLVLVGVVSWVVVRRVGKGKVVVGKQ